MARDNWNYFVGEQDFKTDFLLRFKSPLTKVQYEKHLFASSVFSLRLVLTLFACLGMFEILCSNVSMFSLIIKYLLPFAISLYSTT